MEIYIIGFLISTFILYLIEKCKKKVKYFILASLSVLILCSIAGMRDYSIGVDVNVYAIPMYNNAISSSSFNSFYNSIFLQSFVHQKVSNIEFLYDVLVYFTAKTFNSVHALLFFTEALVIIPVFISLRKLKSYVPTWLGMLVFDLLYYNFSFNIMRQSIAMSFLLLSFTFFTEKKFIKTLVLFFIALFFHNSVIIGIFIYLYYWDFCLKEYKGLTRIATFDSKNNNKNKSKKIIYIFAIGVSFLFLYGFIIRLLSLIGMQRYIGYISGGVYFLPMQILIRIPVILICFCNWKYFKGTNRFLVYIAILLTEIILTQLGGSNSNTIRLTVIFGYFKILAIPDIYVGLKSKILRGALIMYCVVYWTYVYIIANSGNTFPYIIHPDCLII